MMSGDSKFDGDRASDKIKVLNPYKERPYGRSAFDTESEGSSAKPLTFAEDAKSGKKFAA